MFGCMQSLGSRLMETTDYEYVFYEKYLLAYADYEESKKVIANIEDQRVFMELANLYSISKAVPADEKNAEESLADSLAFYVSAKVIELKEGQYVINLNRLQEFKERYDKLEKSKGTSYSMGTK